VPQVVFLRSVEGLSSNWENKKNSRWHILKHPMGLLVLPLLPLSEIKLKIRSRLLTLLLRDGKLTADSV